MAKYHIPSEIFYFKQPLMNFPSLEQTFFSPKKDDQFLDSFSNAPTSGFILNKGREHSDNFFRLTNTPYITHPMGFDFEVSFDNVLEILQSYSIIDGVIQGNLVMCFQGRNLVLIPESIVQQHNSQNKEKFSIEKIINPIVGATYDSSKNMIYLGQFDVKEISSVLSETYSGVKSRGQEFLFSQTQKKQHVFYMPEYEHFYLTKNFNFKSCIDENMYSRTPELINIFKTLSNCEFELSFEKVSNVSSSLREFLKNNMSTLSKVHSHYLRDHFLRLVATFFNGLHSFSESDNSYYQICTERFHFDSILGLTQSIHNINENGYDLLKFNYNHIPKQLIPSHVNFDFTNVDKTIDDLITLLFTNLDEDSLYRIKIGKNEKFSLYMTEYCPKYLTNYFFFNRTYPSLLMSV